MASMRRNVAVSVLFICFGGPAIALVYVPLWLTRFRVPQHEPAWQGLLALLLIIIGLMPALESMRRFVVVGRGTLLPVVPTESLVVSGFYRYVRNPMYVGILLALAGESLLFRSRSLAGFACWLWFGFHLFVLLYEESTLARRYGEEYLRYRQNVPRWSPRITPWQQNAGGNSI
jgi:protein-S-isoprenylcysteine O-methyltransferase Ste14